MNRWLLSILSIQFDQSNPSINKQTFYLNKLNYPSTLTTNSIEPPLTVPRLSVCMAVFNGEKYLKAQIDSILLQIGENDEFVICDDCSTDSSVAILLEYNDNRIVLYENESRLGHVQNFAQAISRARGRYIVLADQDDIWTAGRLEVLLTALINCSAPRPLVIGDFIEFCDEGNYLDSEMNSKKLANTSGGRLSMFLDILGGRSKFYGCCFAFDRALIKYILPISRYTEAHDMWIALVASLVGSVISVDNVVLHRRIHRHNITPRKRRSLLIIVKSRLLYLLALCQIIPKIFWKRY